MSFLTRTIVLIGPQQLETAQAALRNAPIANFSLEMILREVRKARKPSQNEAMWAGVLRDIADQAWVNGRQFSPEVWHEHYKREYLPEDDDPELSELAKDGYKKWDIDPKGNRILVGSTTQLTVKGFARYMQQVEADGANMGVLFHEHREGA